MLIRMISHIAGADFDIPAGGVTDRFPDSEAIRMIEAGMAVPADGSPVELAVRDSFAREKRRRRK